MRRPIVWLPIVTGLLLSACQSPGGNASYRGWTAFGGGPDNIHYSSLTQIHSGNVDQLDVAWTYDTGDAFDGSEMQCNPIVVDGVLYATTPQLNVFALNAETGEELWRFDPLEGDTGRRRFRNRGVSYWTDGEQTRIFFVVRHWLWALDARTGKPVQGFGAGGRVDLRQGLGRDPESITISASTPGVVFENLLILGSLCSEGLPSPPGDIRAFDTRTGELRWTFHTVPLPGQFGADTWPENAREFLGAANNWAGMALDTERGLVYAPTGSAAYDFYGANRHGDNLFANTLLCLDARTGTRKWHFQAVRHDVWDRDFPSAPALVTIRRGAQRIDAVAQITKSGHTYVFDRETGEPLFPIDEHEVPPSPIEGELLARTQPLPRKPPAFSRQQLTGDMLTQRTPEANRIVRERFRQFRSGPQFEPPSLEGTIIFPGFDGGGEWGGAAFDPETSLFYVNANEMAWILRLVPRTLPRGVSGGRNLYNRHCANCHREDRKGSPPDFPSLVGLEKRMSEARIAQVIRNGVGRMPGFAHLGGAASEAIAKFILLGEDRAAGSAEVSPYDLKYTHDGYTKFLDPDGYPAIEPPWGTLNAIDLSTGEIVWKIPFGEFPELAAQGLTNTGSENYGGGIVTKGGLFFIGATNHDRKFRAFDKKTGKLLWETELPASGNATPAMYEVNGRQFIVIGAGGGKSGAKSGGAYVAFALKR